MHKFIQKLLPLDDLLETVKRFPLSVVCAVTLFIIAVLSVHDALDIDGEIIGKLVATLGCLYFWFGISKLVGESQGWTLVKTIVLSVVGGAAIVALIWLTTLWWLHLIFIVPALLLGLMFAPYLTSGDDASVWFFNRQMWFGVAVSYVALFLFAGGVSMGLWAIDMLFDVNVPEELYVDIWFFASLVLGSLYALSWVPKRFEFTKEDCNDPPGLQFIANWISAPMIFLYMGILYAYFGKIVLTGEVPNGHLAYLISGFVGAGIVTYLVAWPMRETGSVQLKLFYKIFFPVLIIPVGFHFFAIWERISAYGITEQRYMLLVSAAWFATIAIGNVMARMPIKVVPASLCIMMVLASFGPWGAVSVSGMSQFSRLEKLLVKHDLLVDGKVVKAEVTLPYEDRLSISSILNYLCQFERDEMLRPWFSFEKKHCYGHDLTKELGFKYVYYNRYRSETQQKFYVSSQGKSYKDISAYDFIAKRMNAYVQPQSDKPGWRQEIKISESQSLHIEYDNNLLKFHLDGYAPVSVDMHDFVKDKIDMSRDEVDLVLVGENDDLFYQIDFYSISGKREDNALVVDNMIFEFLYRIKE